MKILLAFCVFFSVTFLSPIAGWSQFPVPVQDRGFNATLGKLFGEIKSFSAQAESTVKSGGASVTIPMEFALLDGKMRMELDMTKMKSRQVPQEMLPMLKEMGMDRMVNIIVPEKKRMLILYPSIRAYAEMPISDEGADVTDKDFKVDTTEVGKETVDGHPCVKTKVLMMDSKGRKQEGFTWNATDLKNFPIKMEFTEEKTNVSMSYKNIKMSAPDADRFEAPADYTKYSDVQALMQGAMQKMLKPPLLKPPQ